MWVCGETDFSRKCFCSRDNVDVYRSLAGSVLFNFNVLILVAVICAGIARLQIAVAWAYI